MTPELLAFNKRIEQELQEAAAALPGVLSLIEEANAAGYAKYPAYTKDNPNPATGKADCPIDKRMKDAARQAYINRLINAARQKRI